MMADHLLNVSRRVSTTSSRDLSASSSLAWLLQLSRHHVISFIFSNPRHSGLDGSVYVIARTAFYDWSIFAISLYIRVFWCSLQTCDIKYFLSRRHDPRARVNSFYHYTGINQMASSALISILCVIFLCFVFWISFLLLPSRHAAMAK